MKKLALATSLLASLNASAALYDRGNGMIYDSTQNITWLQDANYAQTSGYDVTGLMTWDQATTWANTLVYQGLSGWRLASAGLIGNTEFSTDGSTDVGYNTRSEIGHLYAEPANLGYYSTDGVFQPGYGINHVGPFLNVQDYGYWENEHVPNSPYAWVVHPLYSFQGFNNKSNGFYAWAVRDCDVAAVPVPAAAWLFGTGLLGLLGVARRQANG